MRWIAVCGLTMAHLASASPARAGDCLWQRNSVSITVENDAIGSAGTDEFYTNGLEIHNRVTPGERWSLGRRLPERMRRLVCHELVGVFVGQTMYSPTSIVETDVARLRRDRPYSGWAFLGLSLDWYLSRGLFWKDGLSRLTGELSAGPVGPPSFAENVQRNWHALLRGSGDKPPDPKGWKLNQTRGEAGFNLRAELFTELIGWDVEHAASSLHGFALGLRIDALTRLDLGNVFDQWGLGAQVRLGLLGKKRMGLPLSQGLGPTLDETLAPGEAPDIQPPPVTKPEPRPKVPIELYGYLRAEGRVVAYNATLEREACRVRATGDDCARPQIQKQPLVGDLSLGVVLRVWQLDIGYGQTIRTAEIKAPAPSAGAHDFGTLQLSILF